MGTIVRIAGAVHLDLVERGKRTITSASLSQGMLTDDTVKYSVESNSVLDLKINDTIEVFGSTYRINALPSVKKINNSSYHYDIEAQGLMYDLLRCKFFNADAEGFKTTTNFPLIGNLETFLIAIRNNMQRFSTLWEIGTVASTETKMITFGDDTCLSALQKICQEFKTDFWVKTDAGKFKIHTGNFGSTLPIDFEYGKGKGLYNLSRANVDDNDIVNRLYVTGGSENIPAGYRNFSDSLKFSDAGYLEDTTLIAEMGLKEGSMEFPDIYPKRTGVVSSLGSTKFKFIDSSMDFDLNAKNPDGSTKHLIAGTTAKVHFNKGNLAGYEFEIKKNGYNTATKEFELIPFKNESGQQFPDPDAAAFQIGVGDEYVLLDIVMPDTYIANAESELLAKATPQFALKKVAKVSYDLDVDPEYLKTLATPISIGDYVRVIDTALGINKVIRVQSITRDFITGSAPTPYNYKLTLADSTEISYASQMLLDITDIKSVISITKLGEINLSQLGYKTTQELRNLIFDTDNYFNPENIKPFSIETNMISVGAQSQQLSSSVVFMVNNAGNPNQIEVKDGAIFSQTLNKSWTIAGGIVTIPDNNFRYVYGKCSKTGTTGTIHFTQSQIKFDEDPNDYYFLIGILHTVTEGVRILSITIGSTSINGGLIRTGILSSLDGQTYFNLNTGEIGGRIIFKSGSSGYENLIDKPDLSSFEATRDYVNSALQTDLSDLKNRADGVIESWFYSHSPSLSNLPASNWTTNEQKDSHIGDTFTNMQEFVDNTTTPDAGKAWRFARNADNSYSWNLIANSDSTKALIEAGKAKDTADSKRRVFIAQPFPPYDLGDLWSQGTSGDLMRCKFARASGVYVATDWEKASKYTDDTRAIQAETAAKEYTDDIKLQIDGELSDLATEITNLSDAVADLPIGALTDTVLFGIKQQKNSVQSEYQDVYSRYLIIRDDAALLNKLPVTEAFASYYNAYNSLITYFDSAFNDSAITQAEKDELTARFTDYKNQVSLFATALQNAVQSIQEQKIDNIQIGGRNLLLNTKSDWTLFSGSEYGLTILGQTPAKVGEEFTASVFVINSTSPTAIILEIHEMNEFNQRLKTHISTVVNDKAQITFRTESPDIKYIQTNLYFGGYYPGQTYQYEYSKPKLERGNKATDYTPSPEDVIANIEAAKTAATQAAKSYSDAQDLVKETTTKAYADGIVTAAEQRSINDATAKANAAKSYADAQDANLKILIDAQTDGKIDDLEADLINTSSDNLLAAKSYADAQAEAAREAAKAWADGEITAEETARIAQADANLTNAKNYAEAQDALLKLQQEAYADNKVSASEQATINVAKAYADLKKTEAEAYADGIVDEEEQARLNQALLNLNEAKAHADAVVNNIEIGGRNLLRNSKNERGGTLEYMGIQIGDLIAKYGVSEQEFTMSFDLKSDIAGSFNFYSLGDYLISTVSQNITTEWKRYSHTFKIVAKQGGGNSIDYSIYGNYGTGKFIRAKNIKLELGNKATDWTPAPEDIDAEFVLVKSEINDVDNKLSNLQTNFTDFASDGVINIAEAKALKNIAQTLNNEKADVNQKYLQAYNDANLIDKTPLQTAWNSYNTNHDALLNYINTYTAGNRAISPAELATVNNSFTNYRNALSALSAALESALKAIATKQIDDIQIGGRNLILNSNGLISPISLYGAYSSESPNIPPQFTAGKSTKVSPIQDVHFLRIPCIKEVGTYTFSAWMKRTNGDDYPLQISANYLGTKSFQITNAEWRFITHTIEVTHVSDVYNFFDLRTDTQWVEFLIYNPKIEKGNKATDWTPAPEDLEVEIALAKSQATNAQNTASAVASVTSFLNTDVNGNVVSTGTLQVGSATGANAGITGVVDKPNRQSVRFWAGAPYAGKETAPWNLRENGIMTFNHPNGKVAFEFGLENGKFVMNGYHESGLKIFQLSPNRGLVNVAYIPEDWLTTSMININQSSFTLDETLARNFIVNRILFTATGDTNEVGEQFYMYSILPNFSCFEYSAGTHPDNFQYEVLNGYKDTYQSRVSNITDGWYGLKYGELGGNFGYVRPTFNHAYVLYYIQGGKITKTQIVNIDY